MRKIRRKILLTSLLWMAHLVSSQDWSSYNSWVLSPNAYHLNALLSQTLTIPISPKTYANLCTLFMKACSSQPLMLAPAKKLNKRISFFVISSQTQLSLSWSVWLKKEPIRLSSALFLQFLAVSHRVYYKIRWVFIFYSTYCIQQCTCSTPNKKYLIKWSQSISKYHRLSNHKKSNLKSKLL